MSETTKNKISYITLFVMMFGKRHGLTESQAFRYLNFYKGIHLLGKCYGAMHTLDFDDMMDEVTEYCKKNGGQLA